MTDERLKELYYDANKTDFPATHPYGIVARSWQIHLREALDALIILQAEMRQHKEGCLGWMHMYGDGQKQIETHIRERRKELGLP